MIQIEYEILASFNWYNEPDTLIKLPIVPRVGDMVTDPKSGESMRVTDVFLEPLPVKNGEPPICIICDPEGAIGL